MPGEEESHSKDAHDRQHGLIHDAPGRIRRYKKLELGSKNRDSLGTQEGKFYRFPTWAGIPNKALLPSILKVPHDASEGTGLNPIRGIISRTGYFFFQIHRA